MASFFISTSSNQGAAFHSDAPSARFVASLSFAVSKNGSYDLGGRDHQFTWHLRLMCWLNPTQPIRKDQAVSSLSLY